MTLTDLQPSLVWAIFDQITRIPRPSKHEEQIAAYVEQFARDHGLACKKDATGNLVVVRPASPGRENEKALILQSHMEMVCEKDAAVSHDFSRDPIDAYADSDGWVKARGTTLGADCGIGMALQMAALADPTLSTPRLEALFTVDEEQGLGGAMGLGVDMLTGSRMINLDSEDEGEIFIGCAGGIDTVGTIDYAPAPAPEGYTYYVAGVRGLAGGHSGDDIEKGRANSNKLLTRLLWELYRHEQGMVLARIDGGNLRNAIPREAEALVGLPSGTAEPSLLLEKLMGEIHSEYAQSEPAMEFYLHPAAEKPAGIIPAEVAERLIRLLYALPHGVIAMSLSMPGLVETSTNLASVKMPEPGRLVVTTSQRSSVESAKRHIAIQVEACMELAGARAEHSDGYPGWAPNPCSPLVQQATELYRGLFSREAAVKAIHAGLECGLFLTKYPHLDMISIGPTLRGVHSPAERLEIASVTAVWDYLRLLISTPAQEYSPGKA